MLAKRCKSCFQAVDGGFMIVFVTTEFFDFFKKLLIFSSAFLNECVLLILGLLKFKADSNELFLEEVDLFTKLCFLVNFFRWCGRHLDLLLHCVHFIGQTFPGLFFLRELICQLLVRVNLQLS